MVSENMHSFVRRSVEMITTGDKPDHDGNVRISPVSALIFFLTIVAFAFVMFTVSKTVPILTNCPSLTFSSGFLHVWPRHYHPLHDRVP